VILGADFGRKEMLQKLIEELEKWIAQMENLQSQQQDVTLVSLYQAAIVSTQAWHNRAKALQQKVRCANCKEWDEEAHCRWGEGCARGVIMRSREEDRKEYCSFWREKDDR
jgi:hypothetical protein